MVRLMRFRPSVDISHASREEVKQSYGIVLLLLALTATATPVTADTVPSIKAAMNGTYFIEATLVSSRSGLRFMTFFSAVLCRQEVSPKPKRLQST